MPSPPAAVELRRINKRFGAVHANRDIDLRVEPGSITGIIGENGAGKSTLVSILYGFYTADSGEIRIGGEPIRLGEAADAIAHGIGMVHQHFMLVPAMSVLENVMLGREGGPLLAGGERAARARMAELGAAYGLEIEADVPAGTLPVGLQQRAEILKALLRGARILILDEPTGVLTPQEAERLFDILRILKRDGVTILLITHKLREIMAVTDAVHVMRRGEMVACRETRATSQEELARLMVGHDVPFAARGGIERRQPEGHGLADGHASPGRHGSRDESGERGQRDERGLPGEGGSREGPALPGGRDSPPEGGSRGGGASPDARGLRGSGNEPGSPVLSVEALSHSDERGVPRLSGVSFDLRAAEILGIAGVAGNGQSELLDLLSGIVPPQSGRITIAGRTISAASPADPSALRDLGVAHLPEDRQRRGLVLQFTASESSILGHQDRSETAGGVFLALSAIRRRCVDLLERYDVRPPDPGLRCSGFSGGNQQKMVVARELSAAPRVLLAGQPTRGVDIGAIEFIHSRLLEIRDAGCAILLVSVELEEIMALSDRILVMNAGRIVGEVARGEADANRIGLMMAGVDRAGRGDRTEPAGRAAGHADRTGRSGRASGRTGEADEAPGRTDQAGTGTDQTQRAGGTGRTAGRPAAG